MTSTNPIVANAMATRGVARNAEMTEEQKADFKKNKLPKIEAEVAKFEKDCEDIYAQVKAAVAKADGVAKALSALESKAKPLEEPEGAYESYVYDKSLGQRLSSRLRTASKKITACRDMVSRLGYDIVNAFRVFGA